MSSHIVLNSHPRARAGGLPAIAWGRQARERGPLIGSLSAPEQRNVIGTHSGAYSVYRALAVAAGICSATTAPISRTPRLR